MRSRDFAAALAVALLAPSTALCATVVKPDPGIIGAVHAFADSFNGSYWQGPAALATRYGT